MKQARRILFSIAALAAISAPSGSAAAAEAPIATVAGGQAYLFGTSDGDLLSIGPGPTFSELRHSAVVAGPGCSANPIGSVTCRSANPTVKVYLGDGDDTLDQSSDDVTPLRHYVVPVIVDAGAGDDTVLGSDSGDTLNGGDGKDRLYGRLGGDVLDGGGGKDQLWGSDDNDWITDSGATGDDIGLKDKAFAGNGNDVIDLGAGRDIIDAGSGNDTVLAKDGYRDVIKCGDGTGDRAEIDATVGSLQVLLDKPKKDCELVAGKLPHW